MVHFLSLLPIRRIYSLKLDKDDGMVYVTPGMVVEVVRICYVGVSAISVYCLNVDIIDTLAIVYYIGIRCDA